MRSVTLTGFRPPPRFDNVAWDRIRIREAASEEGPWTALITQNLVPPDADPRLPQTRDITVNNAQYEEGWYDAIFLLSDDTESPRTSPIFNGIEGTLPPDLADLRARSPLIRQRYPADPYDPDRESALQTALEDAIGLVESLTCRTVDHSLTGNLRRLALRAITLKTEQLAFGSEARRRRSVLGSSRLRSFTAGPYSESYFGPEEAAKARVLDPDPALAEVLWALATDECREAWTALWGGTQAPAGAVQSFGWVQRRY